MTMPAARAFTMLFFLLACVHTPKAIADDEWYIGASAGEAYLEIDLAGSDDSVFGFDEGDTAWKVFGGYRWDLSMINLGVEAGYVDLASPVAQFPEFRSELDASGYAVWGVAGFDIGPVGLFGKLGGIAWEIDGETIGSISRPFDDSGTDIGFGAGAKLTVGSLALRAEYENYDIADTENVEMFSLGLVWSF